MNPGSSFERNNCITAWNDCNNNDTIDCGEQTYIICLDVTTEEVYDDSEEPVLIGYRGIYTVKYKCCSSACQEEE